MFVAGRKIPTAIPEIREEVGVDLRVIQVVTFPEERVANKGSSPRRPISSRYGVIVRGCQPGRDAVYVGRSRADKRGVLTDKRIKSASVSAYGRSWDSGFMNPGGAISALI